MAESNIFSSVAELDCVIARIGREIEKLAPSAAHVPSTAPSAPHSRDLQHSANAKRGAKRLTSSTESYGSGNSSNSGNRVSVPSHARNRKPTSANLDTQSSSLHHASMISETSYQELEQVLYKLVHAFSSSVVSSSVSSLDPAPATSEYDLSGADFGWLIHIVAKRAVQQPNLSGVRHQFALLLIAIHRRAERLTLLSLDHVSAFSVTWDATTMSEVLEVLISDVSTSFSPSNYVVHLDCLRALSLVLFDTARLYGRYYGALLAALKPLCDVRIVLDRETHRVTFNCLANMCYKSGSAGQQYYEEIWNLWMRQAALLQPQVLAQANLSRVYSALLRGIQYIIPEAKHIQENGLPSLVSMLHKFIFYGTSLGGNGFSIIPSPSASPNPSSISLSSSAASSAASSPSISPAAHGTHFVGTGGVSESGNSDEDTDDVVSTESEYSGSDAYNDKHGLWKVRFHALGCLQAIARDSSDKFIPFWSHLLPQSPHQPSIISSILVDPVHQVRSAACRLISALFDGQYNFLHSASSPYLSSSSTLGSSSSSDISSFTSSSMSHGSPSRHPSASSSSPKSFTPLSLQLSNMLLEVHNGLYKALTSETRHTTMIAITKTLATLSHETPYDTLPYGQLTRFLLHLQQYALETGDEADHRMKRASISTLASFIGAHTSGREVIEVLNGPASPIVVHFKSLLQGEANMSIKTEVFRFFSALATTYPLLILPHWNEIFPVILETITGEKAQENDPNARYAASKVVDDLSQSLLHLPPEQQQLLSFTSDLWHRILNSRITELMVKDRFGLVRSSICNLFSQIPAPVFASLSRKHQVICITLLLGATKDDVPAVRAQAARALGIYILNHALKVDPLFVSDVALALAASMKDKNLNVRAKAAWSAANLCDALVTLREGRSSVRQRSSDSDDVDVGNSDNGSQHDLPPISGVVLHSTDEEAHEFSDIPRETLVVLAKTLLSLCKDNDKVRCNVVRALGNFIRFANEETFSGDFSGEAALEGRSASPSPPSSSSTSSQPTTASSSSAPSSTHSFFLQQLIEAPMQLTREGSAKVRWNACYALANLFHNQRFVAVFQPSISRVIESLLSVLTTSSNFKVRINAVTALHLAISSGALRTAPHHIIIILQTVLPQLQQPKKVVTDEEREPSTPEFDSKYSGSLQGNLTDLVVGCMAFIASITPLPPTMASFLSSNLELLQQTLTSVAERTSPEDSRTDSQLPSSPTSSSSSLANFTDHDEPPTDSHSQLNPPTFAELQAQAKLGLVLIQSLSNKAKKNVVL